ncbi:hypothetical protein CORC01_06582 [Colletotrichum orchidophilum]|uniref:Uncharacterized protein n=1 Tax=Colletotrichum orchidophilum TaxID=1209926 RepID=A0A1G4B9I9_9PEZI|nr:uncharacterized protein CORC01_06582 [Colletotrichum orchidophilum]OHE98068.1 hypothetical protein CORC01_06582 [Colletotrichum orchidophilum]
MKTSNKNADANEIDGGGTARCKRAVSEPGGAGLMSSCDGQGCHAPLQAVTAARSDLSRRAHNGGPKVPPSRCGRAVAALWVPLGAPDIATPGCDEGNAKARNGDFRKVPGNEESSAAGDHDAVHQQTDTSVTEEPAVTCSKGFGSLSDVCKKAITSSKPISTPDNIASPHEEVVDVACALQTGSRRHPGSRGFQLKSIPASAARITLLIAECRQGSEEPAPRLGRKSAEYDAIVYRQDEGAGVSHASQDDNTSDPQHTPGRDPTQTQPSPLPSASNAGRHFNALQSPGPLSATLSRLRARNGCGDENNSNGTDCTADVAHMDIFKLPHLSDVPLPSPDCLYSHQRVS